MEVLPVVLPKVDLKVLNKVAEDLELGFKPSATVTNALDPITIANLLSFDQQQLPQPGILGCLYIAFLASATDQELAILQTGDLQIVRIQAYRGREHLLLVSGSLLSWQRAIEINCNKGSPKHNREVFLCFYQFLSRTKMRQLWNNIQ